MTDFFLQMKGVQIWISLEKSKITLFLEPISDRFDQSVCDKWLIDPKDTGLLFLSLLKIMIRVKY